MNQTILTNEILKLPSFYQRQVIHRNTNSYFIYEKYLSYYALFLIIIGTICNVFSIVIMFRNTMRKYACMRYLCALAFSDLIVLYQWNLNTFYKYNLSQAPFYFDMEELSLYLCKQIAYLAFTSLETSAWLLSLVSFDRLMMIYSQWWKHKMHKPLILNLMIASVFVLIALINSHLLIFNGYTIDLSKERELLLNYSLNNQSYLIPNTAIQCYTSRFDDKYVFPKWQTANMILYSIIPFSIMLTCNLLIIYNVKFARTIKSSSSKSESRKRRMTYMLLLVTFSFIILTSPSVIVHTFLRNFLKNKPYRRLVNMIVNHSLHTSHAINFFLYVFAAPLFRKEIIGVLNGFKAIFKRNKTNTRLQANSTENNKLVPPNPNIKRTSSAVTSTDSNSIEMVNYKDSSDKK